MSSPAPQALAATKPSGVKKSSVKKYKASGTAKTAKAATSSHPTWKEIVIECITAYPEDARAGVSRNTIKKFAEDRYGLDTSGTNVYQLNRAITSGAEKGTFVLPKGPSGKIKLAPKAKAGGSKENSKPVSARKAAPAVKKVATSTKVSGTKKAAAPAKKPASTTPSKRAAPAAAKKAATTSKKTAATTTKKAPSSTSKRTATAAKKTAGAKKTTSAKTGEKKAAVKSAAAKSRTKAAAIKGKASKKGT